MGGRGPILFLGILCLFHRELRQFSVARLCLDRVQVVLRKKKEMCASGSWPELRCVTVSALPLLKGSFLFNLNVRQVLPQSALAEEKMFPTTCLFFSYLIVFNALRGGLVPMFLEENINLILIPKLSG